MMHLLLIRTEPRRSCWFWVKVQAKFALLWWSGRSLKKYGKCGVNIKKIICSGCGEEKDQKSFGAKGRRCHECRRAYANMHREKYADRYREQGRARYEKQTSFERTLRQVKYLYGLSPEEYDILISGACYVCGRSDELLHIDHDHNCCPGKKTCGNCIRGALCQRCNRGLGQFGDDPSLLRKAADYTEGKGKWTKNQLSD